MNEEKNVDFDFGEVDGEPRERKGSPNQLNLDDEIDFEKFTFRQDLSHTVQGQVTLIPVRRPHPQSWVYIPSEPDWRAHVAVIELPEQRETYLVLPEIAASLGDEVSHRLLVPYQDREGGIFLWALKLADARGNFSSWATSALRICTEYVDQWIKVKAKQSSGCYEVFPAPTLIPAPTWPEGGKKFLLNRAFKDKVITSFDHPIIRRSRGLE